MIEYDRNKKIKILSLRRPTYMCEYDRKYFIFDLFRLHSTVKVRRPNEFKTL